MSILQSAYDTTGYKGYPVKELENAIIIALKNEALVIDEQTGLIQISGSEGITKDIKSFELPLIVNYDNEKHVAVDLRYFVRKTQAAGVRVAPIVTSAHEFDLAVYAGLFTRRWLRGEVRQLLAVNSAIMATYANWITSVLSSRLVLNLEEQTFLKVVSAYFYACQFFDGKALKENDKNSIAQMVSRNTRVPASRVFDIIDPLDRISNINEFIKAIVEQSHSVRLSKLTAGVLLSLLGATWFGVNAKRIVAAAIEYPPIWMALILAAATHRVYRNTAIARSLEFSLNKAKPDVLIGALRQAGSIS